MDRSLQVCVSGQTVWCDISALASGQKRFLQRGLVWFTVMVSRLLLEVVVHSVFKTYLVK